MCPRVTLEAGLFIYIFATYLNHVWKSCDFKDLKKIIFQILKNLRIIEFDA